MVGGRLIWRECRYPCLMLCDVIKKMTERGIIMNVKTNITVPVLLTALCLTGCAGQTVSNTDSQTSVTETAANLSYHQITREEAKKMMASDNGCVILDVGTQEEYDAGHIPGAILIPNDTIVEKRPGELSTQNETILIYCHSGDASEQAAKKLAVMGYSNIFEFGSIDPWDGEIVTDETAGSSTETQAEQEETYSQSYPVQNWQKAYAQELQKCTGTGYLIHLDEDTIPELLIMNNTEVGKADLYSFDGTESYFVDYCPIGYYSSDIYYRPYLSMLGYDSGSVMADGTYNCVMTFGKDANGRLASTGTLQLDGDGHAPEAGLQKVSTYEDLVRYDAPEGRFGESWRTVCQTETTDVGAITQTQIDHWLGDTDDTMEQ